MKQTEILQAHLSLLILQYGEKMILESLAILRKQTVDEMESLLNDIYKTGYSQSKETHKQAKSRLSSEQLLLFDPEKTDLLKSLKSKFENRIFLPELKDVRRFLENHGEPARNIKTRNVALNKVLKILISLSIADLEKLQVTENSVVSGLGIISDQILGRN